MDTWDGNNTPCILVSLIQIIQNSFKVTTKMALRNPINKLTKRTSQSIISKLTSTPSTSSWQRSGVDQLRSFATPVPPVTQDATSSKGPTAMVFMNMGGPSTTDEVGDFLSRLFVCPLPPKSSIADSLALTGRWRFNSSRTSTKLSRASHI